MIYSPQTYLGMISKGNAWTADTQIQSVLSTTPFLRFKFNNPPGSGVNAQIYIYTIFSASPATGLVGKLYKNATTAITANSVTPFNHNIGNALTPQCTITYDQAAADVTGGTQLRTLPIGTNTLMIFDTEIIIVPPGSSIQLTVNQGAIAVAASSIAHLSWIEQAMTG